MAKTLVLYHSFYGHIEAMANAVAEGAGQVRGATVEIKRVPETVPDEVFKKAGGKANQVPEGVELRPPERAGAGYRRARIGRYRQKYRHFRVLTECATATEVAGSGIALSLMTAKKRST